MTDRTCETDESAAAIESAGVEYHPPSNASMSRGSRTTDVRDRCVTEQATYGSIATTRPLSCRVDALTIAYRITELTTQTAKTIAARGGDAKEIGAAELCIGDFSFNIKPSEKLGFISFSNNDFRGVYSPKASRGWTLEVVAQATRLATAELHDVIDEMARIACAFGKFSEKPRLRRFDLAADFIGFPLLSNDFAAIQTTRARVVEHRRESNHRTQEIESPTLRTHRSASTDITGFGISPGNVISGRIYDKTVELESKGDIAKAWIEHELWRSAGWNGQDQVTRVEFQHRGEFLDQTELRDPADLAERMDSIWQRDVQWVRMIVPGSATRRHRGEVDPRWKIVQGVTFKHSALPAIRREVVRGGASVGQLLGAMRSRLAANGKLLPIRSLMVNGAEVLDEQGYLEMLTDSQAEAWVHGHLSHLADLAAQECARELGRKLGWRAAVFALFTQNNATVARFSRVDDTRPDKSP